MWGGVGVLFLHFGFKLFAFDFIRIIINSI